MNEIIDQNKEMVQVLHDEAEAMAIEYAKFASDTVQGMLMYSWQHRREAYARILECWLD